MSEATSLGAPTIRPSGRLKAPMIAVESSMFLIRWAAQSAPISWVGIPQTFSVWLRKKMSKRR